jgi:hypothetical protein
MVVVDVLNCCLMTHWPGYFEMGAISFRFMMSIV